MDDPQVIITEQLDAAKDLIDEPSLDRDAAFRMLDALPDEIGTVALLHVAKAREALSAMAKRDSRYSALARFALARVVVALEQQQAESGWTEPRSKPFDRRLVAVGSRRP